VDRRHRKTPSRRKALSDEIARERPGQRLIVRETGFSADAVDGKGSIQKLYRLIAADEKRNQLILNDVIAALREGRSPVVLTERRDHLECLADQLHGVSRHLVVLKGGMSEKRRREIADRMADIPTGEERLVLATGRYLGEGFDYARLDTLFLAMPVSWKGTLVQYTGRLHRLHPGKTEVRIYDYLDSAIPMPARMFEKRLRAYRAIGYAVDERLSESEQLKFEPFIGRDEDASGFTDGRM